MFEIGVLAKGSAYGTLRVKGGTTLLVAVDGRLAGTLTVSDPIKRTAKGTIDELKRSGVRVVMLTGDRRDIAEEIAGALGISEFEAEILPDGKSAVVKKLQGQGRVVAMAGDGVN